MYLTIQIFTYIELIALGLLITAPDTLDRIIFNIGLGLKIIGAFVWWGMMGGTQSITITATFNNETRTITIGKQL